MNFENFEDLDCCIFAFSIAQTIIRKREEKGYPGNQFVERKCIGLLTVHTFFIRKLSQNGKISIKRISELRRS